jgi:hypothetical protein
MTRLRRCSVRWYRHLSRLQRPVLLTPLGSTTQQGSRPTTIHSSIERRCLFSRFTPPPDAVPVTVLLKPTYPVFHSVIVTPTLPGVPSSLPPRLGMTRYEIRKLQRSRLRGNFTAVEQDLLADATEVECPDSSLYELLQQRNVNTCCKRWRSKDDYGSFGWVIGTNHEVIWDCEGTARGSPMQSYRAEGYGRMSLLLFLTHYIRYHNIDGG